MDGVVNNVIAGLTRNPLNRKFCHRGFRIKCGMTKTEAQRFGKETVIRILL
jgi:hypothetical protein